MPKETTEEYLDRLLLEVNKLKSLLEDPHPGLSTWCTCYAKQMDKIVNFWHPKGEEKCNIK